MVPRQLRKSWGSEASLPRGWFPTQSRISLGAWGRQRQRLARPPTATASSTPPARGAHASPSARAARGARLGHCSPGATSTRGASPRPHGRPRLAKLEKVHPERDGGGRRGESRFSRSRRAAAGMRAGPARPRGGGRHRQPGPGARRCRPPPSWARVRGAHVVGKFRDSKSGRALRGWGGGERAGSPLLPAKAERKKAGGSGGGRGDRAAAT